MTLDEAIKRITDCSLFAKPYNPFVKCEYTQLAEWLKELKERKERQEWIPCKERLPEESGMYLCTCNDGYDNRTTFVKYQKRFSRWDLTGTRSYWKVLAWMPLPPAWEGVDNE